MNSISAFRCAEYPAFERGVTDAQRHWRVHSRPTCAMCRALAVGDTATGHDLETEPGTYSSRVAADFTATAPKERGWSAGK
jgi:hypothetical protein